MFLVGRGALRWKVVPQLRTHAGRGGTTTTTRGVTACVGGIWPLPFACPVSGAIVTQRRFNATSSGDGESTEKGASSPGLSDAPAASSTVSQQEAMERLLEEIQVVLSRPVPIGSLFRALSPTSRKTLVKNKEPLEQLLMRYPEHFALYQQGNVKSKTIYCAPPHLVPSTARRMVFEEPPVVAAVSSSSAQSKDGKGINERILQHDPFAERQKRINTVLQYIPNEWSAFTDLNIPEEVRVKCMGKPFVRAFHYFEKYPQYFEVRQQGIADHSFYVRRSLALQRKTEKPP
ncbi:hypothetical protein MOQ_005061 [Trypanosoma cruzi marinkellei]|uniref:Uncharacterized protein n=1 Tax=Trypanosoma cruzi marinkellei TaxID=85056 RepID=K2M7Y4_TRYCR|nr:hypothetical protein MOQ_005061 [Trypanosoma cruzi marinkellei]